MLVSEQEFIQQVKTRIPQAKLLEASVSFDYYRAKFECPSKSGYAYHLLLRIIYFENQDEISATLESPRESYSVRSCLPFFHNLKDRIRTLALAHEKVS